MKLIGISSMNMAARLATGSVAFTLALIGAGCAFAPADSGTQVGRGEPTDDAAQALSRATASGGASADALSLTPFLSNQPQTTVLGIGRGIVIRPPIAQTPLQRIRSGALQHIHARPMDASPSSREVPYYHGLTYGIGVDSPSGAAMNTVATGAPTTVPNGGGQTMSFTFTEVSHQEDLMSHLGVSADASGGIGLFSASARFNFAKDVQMNSSSVFAVLDLRVMNAFTQIDAPGVTANAAAVVGKGDMTGFQRQFGDRFVRGLLTGGAFFGVVEIATSSETDKQTIESTVSGAYSVMKGSVSLSDSFSKAIQDHSVHVQIYTEGGKLPAQLPTDPVALLNAANAWLPTVETSGVVYTALVEGDSILPLPNPPTYLDLQNQEDVLTACSLDRNADMQSLNDIRYIKQNPSQFENLQGGALTAADFTALDSLSRDLSQDMTTITQAANRALTDPKNAAYPILKVVPPAVIPVKRTSGSWVTVPDLSRDDQYADVNGQLRNAGLVSSYQGIYASNWCADGMVVNQTPAAGTQALQGSLVKWSYCRNTADEDR